MDVVTPTPVPVRAQGGPLALPNLLTYGRIAAVPAVVARLYLEGIPQGGLLARWVGPAVFIRGGGPRNPHRDLARHNRAAAPVRGEVAPLPRQAPPFS